MYLKKMKINSSALRKEIYGRYSKKRLRYNLEHLQQRFLIIMPFQQGFKNNFFEGPSYPAYQR